jgi:hypothetical protein
MSVMDTDWYGGENDGFGILSPLVRILMLLYPFLPLNPPPESINRIAVVPIIITTIPPCLAHQVARAIKTIPTINLETPIEGSGVKNPNVAFAHIQD